MRAGPLREVRTAHPLYVTVRLRLIEAPFSTLIVPCLKFHSCFLLQGGRVYRRATLVIPEFMLGESPAGGKAIAMRA